MTIHLIRHGETDANAARIVQRPDVGLSARGREQAARLAARLARHPVVLVVSSDLARAVETARAVVEATRAPLRLDPGLQERNFGDVRGTSYTALDVDIFGPEYAPPGGETWATFFARVDAAWARVRALAADAAGDVVVVTHGLVCAHVVTHHCEVPGEGPVDVPTWTNTCVTEIDARDGRTVRRLACAAHLDDLTIGGRA